jgi:hypothetical protein
MNEEEDLDDVMKEERSRGRRPIDMKARRERQRLLRDLRRLLKTGDERAFMEAMRGAGLKDGSPEFLEAWRVWREYRQR